MKRWLALVVCALAAGSVAFAGRAAEPEPTCPLEAFAESLSFTTWLALQAAAQTGRCAGTTVPHVIEYSHAVTNRDVPSSAEGVGRAPGDYLRQQSARAEAALAQIRSAQTEDLWRLVQAMASQTFDDELVSVAGELTARLAPQRFDTLAQDAVRIHPDRAPIFERVRKRWLPGSG